MDERLAFLLGAKDHEMETIEYILHGLQLPFAYAYADGERCNSSNALAATSAVVIKNGYRPFPSKPRIVTVECGGEFVRPYLRIDHHRPGDYGYELGPDRYFEGSSIGQVCILLEHEGFSMEQIQAVARVNLKMVAANDHCPQHAFAGLCPDITREGLRAHRIRNLMRFTGRSERKVVDGIAYSLERLKTLPTRFLEGFKVTVLDHHIPNFADAALWYGEPVEYVKEGPNETVKKGIIGALDPRLVKAWMAEQEGKLVNIYGCPVRGYAGGYLP